MRLFLSLLLAIGLVTTAQAGGHAPKGQVILTIGGDLPNPNGPGAGPDTSGLMSYLEIEFASSYGFDIPSLAALPQHQISATIDGPGQAVYSGPRLVDVLTTAGAEGKSAFATALDGYAVELTWDIITSHNPIVATHADGVPFAVGRFGPTVIVFPVVDDAELYDSFTALQVWSTFLITVE